MVISSVRNTWVLYGVRLYPRREWAGTGDALLRLKDNSNTYGYFHFLASSRLEVKEGRKRGREKERWRTVRGRYTESHAK